VIRPFTNHTNRRQHAGLISIGLVDIHSFSLITGEGNTVVRKEKVNTGMRYAGLIGSPPSPILTQTPYLFPFLQTARQEIREGKKASKIELDPVVSNIYHTVGTIHCIERLLLDNRDDGQVRWLSVVVVI
jgi:hypothetical protein